MFFIESKFLYKIESMVLKSSNEFFLPIREFKKAPENLGPIVIPSSKAFPMILPIN